MKLHKLPAFNLPWDEQSYMQHPVQRLPALTGFLLELCHICRLYGFVPSLLSLLMHFILLNIIYYSQH